MARAVLVHWQSGYQSVRGLVQLFAAAWEQQGIAVRQVDLFEANWQAKLLEAVAPDDFRFALLTSGIGTYLPEDGESFWVRRKVPVFSLQLDHPAYRRVMHQGAPANVVQGYLFRDHALFQRDHIGSPNIVTSIHFGIPPLPEPGVEAGPPRIIFPKTGGDPKQLEGIWRGLPARLAALLFDLVDEVGLANCAAFVPAIAKVAGGHGFELRPFDKLGRFLLAQLDDYVRRCKSTMIATALKGFPVDIYGSDWEHVTGSGEGRARFHGAVPFPEVERAIAGAAATVTMNPNVDLSAHDRFFLALGAGKMPLSDRNSFSREHFPDLVPYGFDFNVESIAEAVERVLQNPQETRELAQAARLSGRMRLPLEEAARHILECAQLVNYLELDFKPPQDFLLL